MGVGVKKKFSFTVILFIAGIILAATISTSAVKEAYRNRKIEKEVENLKKEAERIQNDNNAIQQRIEYYSTPQFVERVSKDKINLQKPDENVVIVNQGVGQQPSQVFGEQKEVVVSEQNIPNYLKWWNLFFGYN